MARTTSSLRLLRICLMGLAGFWFGTCAQAETGLRVSPRLDDGFPGKLRLSTLDSTYPFSHKHWSTLSLPTPGDLNLATPSLRADWYPFGSSGLRTSAGMLWHDQTTSSGAQNWRSEAFVGLGWTASGSSSSTGSGWSLSADLGANLGQRQDCGKFSTQCASSGSTGLRPGSSGSGIRWEPFISIGASLYY